MYSPDPEEACATPRCWNISKRGLVKFTVPKSLGYFYWHGDTNSRPGEVAVVVVFFETTKNKCCFIFNKDRVLLERKKKKKSDVTDDMK